nr:multiple epidermal growth factor-like domains protein 10 [Crassostrea gigas]
MSHSRPECPSGLYGKNCNQQCSSNCFVTNNCNRFTGQCDKGCKPGWIGSTCDQECSEGYHGRNCLNRCSVNCKLNNRCDRFTGQCIEGCNPGWIGDTCNFHQVCGRGYFGPDCRNKCGQCLNVSQCHYINGSCLAGCVHGYRGDYCNETCPRGFYGLDCSSRCDTYCSGNETCDHVTGRCDEGCKNELIGPMCKKVDKTYRDQQPCSNHTPIIISVVLSIVIVLSGSIINFIFWRKKAGHNIQKRREIQISKNADKDAPQLYTELEEVSKPNTYDEIVSYAT